MDAVERLYDPFRQGEHPEASPVGNGQIGDANQPDHRPWDLAAEEPAMNDGMGRWDHAPPLVDLGDLPALEDFEDLPFENLPLFDDMMPAQLPVGDYERPGLDFNFAPAPFGFDDLIFR